MNTHFMAALCLSNAFLAFGTEVTASETGAGPPNKIFGVKRDPFLILGEQRIEQEE